MTSIPGIYASQISGHLWAPAGAYEPIGVATAPSAGVTSITFGSIPATYTHLQIRFLAQSLRTSSDSGDFFLVRFNSDSGANYNYGHQLLGNGATTASYANGNNGTSIYIERIQNNETLASSFTAGVTDILDYSNTNKYKTTRSLLGYSTNTAYGQVNFASGLWMSSAAISSISISLAYGPIAQYSSFALYGIKG